MFPQEIKGYQPYVKVTSRVGAAHELSGFFQRDRTHGQSNWQYYFDPINVYSNGGNVYSAKLTSAWGDRLTTTFSAGYNNKSGNDNDTYEAFGFNAQGPNINIYDGTRISSGFITGNSLILEGGNNATRTNVPASLSLIRGDLTYYKAGWGGNHEFGTGFFLEPQNIYDQVTAYTNDGFFREYQTVVDVNNPSRGTRPYRRDYATPISLQTRQARDSNYAFYVQDSWKPNDRLTANLGIRFDYVKRVDEVKNITRQKSWAVQPRIGATYLLTNDAKNVLRASYGRLGEQVMGRDGVTIFGADDTVSFRREYDNDLDGMFETTQLAAGDEHRRGRPADRARPASAVPRRVHRRIPPAVRLADWPGRGLHQPRLQAHVGERRHQRHLSRRTGSPVRRFRQSRSEPGTWSSSRRTTPGAS